MAHNRNVVNNIFNPPFTNPYFISAQQPNETEDAEFELIEPKRISFSDVDPNEPIESVYNKIEAWANKPSKDPMQIFVDEINGGLIDNWNRYLEAEKEQEPILSEAEIRSLTQF